MSNRNKSILLQVAFKEANGDEEKTQILFNTLLKLHETNGISLEDEPRKGGFNKAGGQSPAPIREISGTLFFKNGEKFFDFRQAKAEGREKPAYPDFKSEDLKTSFWMYDRDGSPNPEVAALVEAADAAVPL